MFGLPDRTQPPATPPSGADGGAAGESRAAPRRVRSMARTANLTAVAAAVLAAAACCRPAAGGALDADGYFNDSPYEILPPIKNVRLQMNSTHSLKCIQHDDKSGITWESKKCETSTNGIICDTSDVHVVGSKNNNWKYLSNGPKFEITAADGRHNGLYRCLKKGLVKKAYIVKIVENGRYTGPKPEVVSLKTSNITSTTSIEFVIQCNVTSVVQPTVIFWFKKCYGLKCDINYDDTCYCHLNQSSPLYNTGNTYISKINIMDAKEADSGLYVCLAVSRYGNDRRNVTIFVPKLEAEASFSKLFMIPFGLILAPVIVWMCYYRGKRKAKPEPTAVDRQKYLI